MHSGAATQGVYAPRAQAHHFELFSSLNGFLNVVTHDVRDFVYVVLHGRDFLHLSSSW